MTNNKQDRSIAPLTDDAAAGDGGGPLGPIRDPLAWMSEQVGEDPSLAELIAFRNSRPDLKAFAREAKRCEDEADRLPFGLEETRDHKMTKVGLRIFGLGCSAIVAIWPTDTIEEADAKQALARETRMHGDDAAYGIAPMLSVETATRIRLHRAAFSVGEGIVPPAPPPPSPDDRGLANWPLSRFDLVDMVPHAGGEMTLSNAQVARWLASPTPIRRSPTSSIASRARSPSPTGLMFWPIAWLEIHLICGAGRMVRASWPTWLRRAARSGRRCCIRRMPRPSSGWSSASMSGPAGLIGCTSRRRSGMSSHRPTGSRWGSGSGRCSNFIPIGYPSSDGLRRANTDRTWRWRPFGSAILGSGTEGRCGQMVATHMKRVQDEQE